MYKLKKSIESLNDYLKQEDIKFRDYADYVYKIYKQEINMNYSELKDWSQNNCSREASLSREPILRNLRLLKKPKSIWTKRDVIGAVRTILYLKRSDGIGDGKIISDECPYTNNQIARRNWGKR